MSPDDQVLRQKLLELLDGEWAHIGLKEALADFPVERVDDRATGIPHSMWELLEHMRISLWDINSFIRDSEYVSPEFPAGYWPVPELYPEDPRERWMTSLDNFLAEEAILREMVTSMAIDLFADLPYAPGYSLLRQVMVVANHNSYHLGQMVTLRKALGLWD